MGFMTLPSWSTVSETYRVLDSALSRGPETLESPWSLGSVIQNRDRGPGAVWRH